jgi:hypothetical protein
MQDKMRELNLHLHKIHTLGAINVNPYEMKWR